MEGDAIQTGTPSTLAAESIAAARPFDEHEQRLALGLYRLLAKGEPVDAGSLAEHVDLQLDQVERALGDWAGIFTDEDDRVIGFLGLSIRPMPHRLTVADRTLYAWCAFDTLFLPELLGERAEVQSQCPTTSQQITLAVEGTDVTGLQPADAMLSYLHNDEPLDQHVITTFYHYIHFFANPAAAAEWNAKHDGTFTISMADGSEIARLVNRGRYPSLLAA